MSNSMYIIDEDFLYISVYIKYFYNEARIKINFVQFICELKIQFKENLYEFLMSFFESMNLNRILACDTIIYQQKIQFYAMN